eukprot:gnl/TRDRNA2_/TRDRNA2_141177_c2_seq1.p2 gnl/TRDRNA2_/TRDRNA2_141177_c2~~gnl/TRDRNA2_/TRDRNA2_141177_c2_seq1.p2  ORF type:complete len:101 (-),score=11.71 gnl/TRDRNA2_/TRDRNA2_141177_c2_seq1:231-533(-)
MACVLCMAMKRVCRAVLAITYLQADAASTNAAASKVRVPLVKPVPCTVLVCVHRVILAFTCHQACVKSMSVNAGTAYQQAAPLAKCTSANSVRLVSLATI